MFERAKIQLSDDKTFEVYCHNYSPKHKYIQSVKLDGVEWDKSWFSHEELMKGNKLEVTMGAYPNKEWKMIIILLIRRITEEIII